jgi:hypothetical protein
LASDPRQGVAEAIVKIIRLDPNDGPTLFITDAEGNFRGPRPPGKFAAFVQSADKSLAAMVRFEESDDECVIPLHPIASAHGRLVDEGGLPLAGQTLDFDIPFPEQRGLIGYFFLGGSVETGPDGVFEISKLATGAEYSLSAPTRDAGGQTIGSRTLTTLTVEPGETLDLGDVVLKSR